MASLADAVLELLRKNPGSTDRELAEILHGPSGDWRDISDQCRQLAETGLVVRRLRADGIMGNHLSNATDA
ncbi:MAG: hypothetical protein FJX35_10190 [Alphaproteobacteria bacterium]|nr:hypothetical protein [Alphaproteobacteria bacterium]